MRLGEGSGGVLAMPVIESAAAVYREMATFSSAAVSEAQ
jgi:nicotinate-nucleotide--dimethylbenzimidazole phosphoribosyltransferase